MLCSNINFICKKNLRFLLESKEVVLSSISYLVLLWDRVSLCIPGRTLRCWLSAMCIAVFSCYHHVHLVQASLLPNPHLFPCHSSGVGYPQVLPWCELKRQSWAVLAVTPWALVPSSAGREKNSLFL